ncbi:zinc ribbon domain-containing protein, partial [Ferrithrix thermotolerans]|uniref:zinc ribbon domain-containing protein n=1 Tax=Ferrithrix thermotolerans TaxID=209649 RepID=UPI003AF3A5D4
STKLHHGCGGTLAGKKLAKALTCEICGKEVDRDHNAAENLRDLAKVQRQSWCSWRQCPVRTRAT